MKEGVSYYVQAGSQHPIDEKADEIGKALAELCEYGISSDCFGLMPLLEDGTVQYYWEMLPEGKISDFDWWTGKVYATLPQEEFEVGLQNIIDTYCRNQE